MSAVRRVAIIGPARAGKDTVAAWLAEHAGHTPSPSTSHAAAWIVWRHWHLDHTKGAASITCPNAAVVEEFWRSHSKMNRQYWAAIMWAYNWSDGSGCRLYRNMIAHGATMLCGIRRQDELDACIREGLVDDVIRVIGGEEDPTFQIDDADVFPCWVVDNRAKDPTDLDQRMRRLIEEMHSP